MALIADAIVVAAGSSSRMQGVDKLLAPIGGQPLIVRSVAAMRAAPEVRRLVVVVAGGREAEIAALLGVAADAVVAGGSHRGASVEAGLAALEAGTPGGLGDRIVLVHDAARPLVPPSVISAVASATDRHGAAIPVLPVADTLRRLEGDRLGATVDRAGLVAAQTPQGVRASLLRRAFTAFPPAGERRFTDEAGLLDACTIPVHPVPGDPVNLKVTVPADLRQAEAILAMHATRRSSLRVGLGTDSHPFGPGETLRLGGVEIAGAPALHGHSDGDVVLHAIADALLGAAAMGDLGRLFPADPRTPRGISSAALLREVVSRLQAEGWRPVAVDLTIVGARPRLGAHLESMRTAIAELLGLRADAVNVKASSGNLDGSEGAGRVISATAVATIDRAGSATP